MAEEQFFLGIDGGGTNCRARLADHVGRTLGEGAGGSANATLEPELVMDSILTASRAAARAAGLSDSILNNTHAGFGLAGAVVKSACRRLLRVSSPFASIRIESDAYAAWLGAYGGSDGAILITGTGSCGLAVIRGQQFYVSGWGSEISDEGSGMSIGREAIRRALWVHDGRSAPSPLSQAILGRFEHSPELMASFAAQALPADYGRFAPIVLEYAQQRDPLALSLMSEAATQAVRMIARLLEVGAPSVCLLGGLAKFILEWLPPPFRSQVGQPQGDAMDGAILMARLAVQPTSL